MADPSRLSTTDKDQHIQMVIETPKGSTVHLAGRTGAGRRVLLAFTTKDSPPASISPLFNAHECPPHVSAQAGVTNGDSPQASIDCLYSRYLSGTVVV
jgi:hypothetical protein